MKKICCFAFAFLLSFSSVAQVGLSSFNAGGSPSLVGDLSTNQTNLGTSISSPGFSNQGSVLKFDLQFESGESQLGGDDLTVSGVTETADCAYRGKDYSAGSWSGTQGGTLTKAAALTDPGEIYGPFADGTEAVKFLDALGLQTDVQQSANNTDCAITTQDAAFEFVVRFDPVMATVGGTSKFILKANTASTSYWFFSATFNASNIDIKFEIDDGTSNASATVSTVSYNEWNHFFVLLDRQNGMRTYVNGVGGSVDAAFAISGSIDDAVPFRIGGETASESSMEIAYVKTWAGVDDSWFSSLSQDDLAKERFYRVAGWYPDTAPAGDELVTFSRSSSASFGIWDGTANTDSTKVHTVGPNWPRVQCRGEQWRDSTNRMCGALVESQQNQILLNTEDASSWDFFNVTSSNDILIAPDGRQTADEIIPTTTANTYHLAVNRMPSVTVNDRGSSVYIKPGSQGVRYVFNRSAQQIAGVVFDIIDCEVEAIWDSVAISTYKGTTQRLGAAGSWCRIELTGSAWGVYLLAMPPAGLPTEASCVADILACSSFAASNTFDPLFYVWGSNLHESPAGYPNPQNRSASSYVWAGATTETRVGDMAMFDPSGFYDPAKAQTIITTFQAQPMRYGSISVHEWRHFYTFNSTGFNSEFISGFLNRDYYAAPGPDIGGYEFYVDSRGNPTTYSIVNQSYPTVYDDGIAHTSVLHLAPGDFRGYVDGSLQFSETLYNPPGEVVPVVDLNIGSTPAPFLNIGASKTIIDQFQFYEGDETP